MLYSNELFQPVKKGQKLSAYIKHIRDDFKIDLSLQIQGYVNKVLPLTDNILNQLKANNGVLAISDKSPPEEIYATFGVSKKVFKQAIGALYKQQKISIEKTEIRLL
jgi:predicted RNA-binding protein (virulence factor B family)